MELTNSNIVEDLKRWEKAFFYRIFSKKSIREYNSAIP